MNTAEEIHQALPDYRNTQFGVWPWPTWYNMHPRDRGRLAGYSDSKKRN